MVLGQFEKELSSMFSDSGSDSEEVESQGFGANTPPRSSQGFSFHDPKDIVGERIESCHQAALAKNLFARSTASFGTLNPTERTTISNISSILL
jgi:hypothetical protein